MGIFDPKQADASILMLEAMHLDGKEKIIEGLKNLKAEYESRLANKDNRVNVLAPSGAWQGICLGIKEDGALLVQREDGKVEEVIAGEVSVRGIYGYV